MGWDSWALGASDTHHPLYEVYTHWDARIRNRRGNYPRADLILCFKKGRIFRCLSEQFWVWKSVRVWKPTTVGFLKPCALIFLKLVLPSCARHFNLFSFPKKSAGRVVVVLLWYYCTLQPRKRVPQESNLFGANHKLLDFTDGKNLVQTKVGVSRLQKDKSPGKLHATICGDNSHGGWLLRVCKTYATFCGE